MKTFKQFQEGLSLSQAFDRAGYKPGIPSERPTRTTTLPGLVQRQRERATAVQQAVQLPYSTYSGRVVAGRNTPDLTKKRVGDNPNFQGPIRGVGPGTRDRMPGTTPESNPQLPPPRPITSTKKISPRPMPKPSRTGGSKPKPGIWV